MKKLLSINRWTVLSVVFATILVVALVLTEVASLYAPVINSTLSCETTKIITKGEQGNTTYFPADYTSATDARTYLDTVCKEVEGEGLVLLKNDNSALPLTADSKVSCFGTASVNINCSVQGIRGATDKTDYPTLKAALEADTIQVNSDLWAFYLTGAAKNYGSYKTRSDLLNADIFVVNEVPWSLISANKSSFSEYGDAAIVVLTRESGEGSDINATGGDTLDGSYLTLSQAESDMLKQLTILKSQGTFKKIVVLLNTAMNVQLDFLYANDISVDACMWIGNLGSAGVYAVADALVGKINPSGRLSDTLCKDNFSSPAMASWILNDKMSFSRKYSNAADYNLNSTQSFYGVYVEGIYVGYRYYETRYADTILGTENVGNYKYEDDVAFPFGFGLSYTSFDYEQFKVEENGNGDFEVSVKVTNVGTKVGKETVQIYLSKPYVEGGLEKSAVELVGFGKTKLLDEDESQTITVTVEKSLLTSYDNDDAKTYVLDKGDYYFAVGNDAHDALNNILAARAKVGMTDLQGVECDGDVSLAKKWNNATYDKTTFSVSSENNYTITNRLDFCDINKYKNAGDNSVAYLSRADWTGTWPTSAATVVVNDEMVADLQNLTEVSATNENAAKFSQINNLTLIMLRNDEEIIPFSDTRWTMLVSQMTFDEVDNLLTTCICQTAGVTSISKPETKESDGPAYVKETNTAQKGVDTGARFPCEGIIASSFNTELIQKVGEGIGIDAVVSGVNGMYAPGMNIHRTPFGGRAAEYYSEDPVLSGMAAQYEVKGIQSKGIVTHVKHFVFNDEEAKRDGIGIWLNEQEAREIMLRPFQYATAATRGNSHAVMSSFNRAGCVWTSADKGLITEILRNEWGFDGYVITDYADGGLQYMTLLDGLMAGTDCWLSNGVYSFAAYKGNNTVCIKMQEAAKRINYVICNYSNRMNGLSSNSEVVLITPWWQATIYAADAVLGVLFVCSAVFYVLSRKNEII